MVMSSTFMVPKKKHIMVNTEGIQTSENTLAAPNNTSHFNYTKNEKNKITHAFQNTYKYTKPSNPFLCQGIRKILSCMPPFNLSNKDTLTNINSLQISTQNNDIRTKEPKLWIKIKHQPQKTMSKLESPPHKHINHKKNISLSQKYRYDFGNNFISPTQNQRNEFNAPIESTYSLDCHDRSVYKRNIHTSNQQRNISFCSKSFKIGKKNSVQFDEKKINFLFKKNIMPCDKVNRKM